VHYVELVPKRLVALSELALCVYLQKYGKPNSERDTWTVAHEFNLREVQGISADVLRDAKEATRQSEPVLRAEFTVTLNRPLPEPIVKLETLGPGAR
jgi:hypothetical protein